MKIFLEEGYSVTAGVLNVLDTDFETTEFLNIPVASEAPFSPITEKTQKANLAMISKASTVVVTSVPFGHGNLQNLKAAKEALKKGIPLFVIDEVPIESRDFTQGQATALLGVLKSMGAVFVKNQDELLHMLNVSEEKLKMTKDVLPSIADHLKAGRAS
jgi:iron complex transport system ATP-binding protein